MHVLYDTVRYGGSGVMEAIVLSPPEVKDHLLSFGGVQDQVVWCGNLEKCLMFKQVLGTKPLECFRE